MSLTNPNTPISEQDLHDFYNIIKPYLGTDEMPSGDMADVINPLPSVSARRMKYSTEEQIVGEWIDGKPVYQKSYQLDNKTTGTHVLESAFITNHSVDWVVDMQCIRRSHSTGLPIYPGLFMYNTNGVTSQFNVSASGDLQIVIGGTTAYWDTVATIRYTKTTD